MGTAARSAQPFNDKCEPGHERLEGEETSGVQGGQTRTSARRKQSRGAGCAEGGRRSRAARRAPRCRHQGERFAEHAGAQRQRKLQIAIRPTSCP